MIFGKTKAFPNSAKTLCHLDCEKQRGQKNRRTEIPQAMQICRQLQLEILVWSLVEVFSREARAVMTLIQTRLYCPTRLEKTGFVRSIQAELFSLMRPEKTGSVTLILIYPRTQIEQVALLHPQTKLGKRGLVAPIEMDSSSPRAPTARLYSHMILEKTG